ncbi:MAG TPA: hypothetical protein VLL72_10525, partial [Kiloniellales bacterium]|nr:hypothetical protein [Kiloniellales bacterium]
MTGPIRTRLLAALAALLLAAPGAQAAETLGLRVGAHPGFSRLVFDWTKPVETRLKQAPGRATLRFDRAATLDTGRFRPGYLPEVVGITSAPGPDGLTVVIRTSPDTRLRLFENGPSVVLDVLHAGTAPDAAPHGADPVPASTVRPVPKEHQEEAQNDPMT